MTRPLSDILVLDLTQGLAGPFASMTLADLGARVIKVERPGRGDDGRAAPPFKTGKSVAFAGVNHSKSSIALDLKSDADCEIFEKLLARADVILENYRPGVMDRLGYGWETLHAVHPRLIYGALSGYGHSGPEMKRPVYDTVVQARGGMMSLTGACGGGAHRAGASTGSVAAAMYLTQGVLAALFERERTGVGRKVDIAMLDAQWAMLDHAVARATTEGATPGRTGNRAPSMAPSDTYEASDGAFVIVAGNDVLFEKLCVAVNLPIADDPRFASNALRVTHARLLKRLIEAVTLENTRAFWIARLAAAGIPSGPVQSIEQVMRDPQIAARNMVVDVLDRNGRPAFRAAGNPIKISGISDPAVRPAAPDLDGNRGEILRWLEDG